VSRLHVQLQKQKPDRLSCLYRSSRWAFRAALGKRRRPPPRGTKLNGIDCNGGRWLFDPQHRHRLCSSPSHRATESISLSAGYL